MDATARQLPLLGGSGNDVSGMPQRRERRENVVRHVEYVPFPRVSAHQHERVGFTRDLSSSGMCLRVETPQPVGSLLRLVTHGVDGRPARESIARVVWSSPTADGAFWLGLSVLERGPGSAHPQPLRAAGAARALRSCA